ncbi:MAG: hypothetical protein HETSPECPRED_004381 [Heterodermia speciosa]|uniref:Uncharacterized protein n=1 Tax=Heterodermia speciosa TaxID=116794 RepID=A0A8H3PJL0_9LECA|nr:MAG: hypothetical protein HETSPECPRED_004381 [Heterodermia speciosa]
MADRQQRQQQHQHQQQRQQSSFNRNVSFGINIKPPRVSNEKAYITEAAEKNQNEDFADYCDYENEYPVN